MNTLDLVSLGEIVTIREQLMAASREGMRVYRLESGDPSFDIHPRIAETIRVAVKTGKTHYMPVDGIPELRKAISDRARSQGLDVDPSDVFVTNGAMHALYIAYQALHDDRSDNLIAVPEPMWTEAVENIRLAGMEPCPFAFDAEDSNYTLDKFKGKYLDGIFLNSPHNPTGKVLTVEQKQAIADYAVEEDLWLISDEAYESVTYDQPHTLAASLMPKSYDKWISIHSMSKSFSMSGLRVGWIITKNPLIKSRLSKISRCTINGVNHVTQWAAVEALSIPQDDQYFIEMKEEYKKRRQIIFDTISNDEVAKSVLKPIWPEGGFFLWCKVNPAYSADALSEKLARHGMGNAPGSCFGDSCSQAMRFSFSIDTKQVEDGSKYLVQLLNTKNFLDEVRV